MRILLFKNCVHNTEPIEIPGYDEPRAINLTVRKGLKWSSVKVGETVEIQRTDDPPPEGAPRVYAKIFDVKVMTFYHLHHYGRMLELEHDPDCRTFSGLYKTMRNVYDGFLQHELVTLVFYELLPTE
jgi:hypothetical protein